MVAKTLLGYSDFSFVRRKLIALMILACLFLKKKHLQLEVILMPVALCRYISKFRGLFKSLSLPMNKNNVCQTKLLIMSFGGWYENSCGVKLTEY